ncbi:MAG TPA: acyltransferase family protein [Caulobacterales bacterium]|nr:acyltransferase family protein [Caulobacterales bacterium]
MSRDILAETPSGARAVAGTRAVAQAPALRMDIQGLRGIAVLSVVAYHANRELLSGGFVGVDIFFVISGYLIAGILLKEMEAGRYTLAGFYERRVRRLFPALFTMLALTGAVSAFVLSPRALQEFAHTAASTILFVSNIDFFSMSGYFDSDAHQRPLLHTWSLAVEEQFYLLFPIVLFILVKFARKSLRVILAAGIILSFAAAGWMVKRNASAAFYLAPFRADELLIGAVLAGVPFPSALPRWVRSLVSLIGLALIGYTLVAYSEYTPFPGIAALTPCIGAALVLFAGAGEQSLGGGLISIAPLTGVGAISYSLYLWHWPALVLGRAMLASEPTFEQTTALLGIALIAATLSYVLIEKPFLRQRGGPALRLGALVMGVGLACAAITVKSHGFPQRFDTAAQAQLAAADTYSPLRGECHNLLASVRAYSEACVYGDRSATPHIALWSDSHGTELAAALGERLARRGQAMVGATSSACPPALDFSPIVQPRCAAQNAETFRGIQADTRIDTVIFAANFTSYGEQQWPRLAAGMARAMEAVAASGKQVVIVAPTPIFFADPPSEIGLLTQRGQDPRAFRISRGRFETTNARVTAFIAREAGLTHAIAVRPARALCDATYCYAYGDEAGVLYFNHDHLSMAGARLVAAQFPAELGGDDTRAIARGRGRTPPALSVGRVRRA